MFSMRWFGQFPKHLVKRSSLRVERLEVRDVPAHWYAVGFDSSNEQVYDSVDQAVPNGPAAVGTGRTGLVLAESPDGAVRQALVDGVALCDAPNDPRADRTPFQPAPTVSGYEVRLVTPATTPSSGNGGTASIEFDSVDEKDRPAPPEGMDAHKWELGWDPAKKKYVESEADTALRLEKQQGVKLKRYFPKDAKEKGDFVDEKGVVYDGCSPPKTEFFDKQWENYQKSLDEHLAHPTVDKVVIDTTGLNLTEAQLKQIDDYIKSLPKDKQDKIVRIK